MNYISNEITYVSELNEVATAWNISMLLSQANQISKFYILYHMEKWKKC